MDTTRHGAGPSRAARHMDDGRHARHSEQLRLTERFTRIDPEMVDYEIRIEDPMT